MAMSEIIIYQTSDGEPKIDVKLEDENIWLNQQQIAELYQSSRTNVVEHIKHIYEEGELVETATCRKFRQVQKEGKREVSREIPFFNLDMIISLGYRINSKTATIFRIWATERLKEYIKKGFTVDSDRLKNLGGGNYWKELLDTIRDIRSSEKVMYRQVLDLYATAIDYNPTSSDSIQFFKIVQNKLHFAAHGNTAAEIVYFRVDSDKPFAGMTHFRGAQPTIAEAFIAKNYLQLEELKVLNNLVSAYFDLAEINAIEEKPMRMKDYIEELDRILTSTGRALLQNPGKVSHTQAVEKAEAELRKYQVKTLSEVEKAYVDNLKQLEIKVKKQRK